MENFITGFPGREYQIRKALADVLGKEKAQFFFDKVHSSPPPPTDKQTNCIYSSSNTSSPKKTQNTTNPSD